MIQTPTETTKPLYAISELYTTKSSDIMGVDNKDIMYLTFYQEVTWKIWCRMDFNLFPLDNQVGFDFDGVSKLRF